MKENETEFLDDIMGFNPADLNVFNEPANTSSNGNVYKTNPSLSKSEDGHYRSNIRLLYNPFNIKNSIIPSTKYAMRDMDGFFMVDSMLSLNDKNCPIFKAWKKLWFSGDENKKNWAKKMFDKSESQWVLVQIIEDDNQPEMVGKIKVMKLPYTIFDKLSAKMNPAPESKKAPLPLMDFLFGPVLEMDVAPGPDDPNAPERKQREISYTLCEFGTDICPIRKTDGTQLFSDEELQVLEDYYTKRMNILKAKSETQKEKLNKEIEAFVPQVKQMYAKAIDYLKENALDPAEECGYKEWDPATKQRVENWINMVLEMRDPSKESAANAPKPMTIEDLTPEQSQDMTAAVNDLDNDDLPF